MDTFESLASQYQYLEHKDEQGEDLRRQFLSKFPAAKLSSLTLQQYALGLEPKEDSFCYWLEFETDTLGRIRGATSFKHVVFFSKKKNKWEFDSKYADENTAFDQVRKGLVALVQLAAEGKYEQLESIEPFNGQNLTRGKILFLYHSDKFLPVYSVAHLKAFCLQLGVAANLDSQIAMNRALMQFKDAHSETKHWSNLKFSTFLYDKYPPRIQFWKVAPGEKARYWDDCRNGGFICMGFDEIGDVRQFEGEEDFKSEFRKKYPSQPPNKWRELWNFANEINEGDTVIANKGLSSIVGTGKSDGEYYFDSTRGEFRHCVRVNWEDTQERAISADAKDIVKDWSFNTVKKIGREDFLKLGKPASPTSEAAYLLAWNPKKWNWDNLSKLATQSRSGEQVLAEGDDACWRVNNKSVRPNDRLYLIRLVEEPKGIMGSGYSESVPYQDEHYSDPEKTADYVKLRWDTLLDPEHDEILSLEEIEHRIPEVHWTTQSSGILIPPEAHAKLEQMWKTHLSHRSQPLFTKEVAVADVFLEPSFFAEICELALRRKNVVLQGPPGVGKTFVAKRLAYALLGAKDDSRLEWVQFHQSYSYEDFILGFRPNGSGFELKEGIFYRFCKKARSDGRPHVFVIDEINRGNLSRIFGEALSAIEDDKRGELSLALAYGDVNSETSKKTGLGTGWTIPPNLILLGLMNTADRSLAVVDYALRRRFAFIDLVPQFDSPKFEATLDSKGVSQTLRENIKSRLKALNSRICADKRNLGRGFEIGHSFFCPKETIQNEAQWFRSIIMYEIKPLLMEYWFDDQDTATREIKRLLGENPD